MLLNINKLLYRSGILFLILNALVGKQLAVEYENRFETFYKNKSVLVTGGCGFIGSHLVEKLVILGAQVTVLDDLSSGTLDNITSVIDNVTFMRANICDRDACMIAANNKDIIFHLAAFVSVPGSVENPHTCHESNITGTENMLEAARINNVPRFVFSSSSAVYGETDLVCNENSPTQPTSPYGISKLMGEMYCREYADVFDKEVVVLRYFNVYGPRQNPQAPYAGVVAKFIYNMENQLPLIIFGDGMQTRDFVPVATVVEANVILGMLDKKVVQGEIFNIATGKSINLFELINTLKEKYPEYSEKIVFKPARPGDVKNTTADCTKYFTLLDQRKQ